MQWLKKCEEADGDEGECAGIFKNDLKVCRYTKNGSCVPGTKARRLLGIPQTRLPVKDKVKYFAETLGVGRHGYGPCSTAYTDDECNDKAGLGEICRVNKNGRCVYRRGAAKPLRKYADLRQCTTAKSAPACKSMENFGCHFTDAKGCIRWPNYQNTPPLLGFLKKQQRKSRGSKSAAAKPRKAAASASSQGSKAKTKPKPKRASASTAAKSVRTKSVAAEAAPTGRITRSKAAGKYYDGMRHHAPMRLSASRGDGMRHHAPMRLSASRGDAGRLDYDGYRTSMRDQGMRHHAPMRHHGPMRLSASRTGAGYPYDGYRTVSRTHRTASRGSGGGWRMASRGGDGW
jgi:hypothetical protein